MIIDSAWREHEGVHIPAALLDGAQITGLERADAPRPWGNDGQASVDVLEIELTSGVTRKVIWKHARVPPTDNKSKEEADKRLASFEAEAAFFTACAPRLAVDTHVPNLWGVSHSWNSRWYSLWMSNLIVDGYPRQPAELSLDLARRALEWCAHLHAEFWAEPNPPGLWAIGSYYNLAKTTGSLSEARMRSNLHAIKAGKAHSSLAPRLFRAAVPLDTALHEQGLLLPATAPAPTSEDGLGAQMRRSARKRSRASVEEEEAAAARAVRLPLHRTVVHGDAKCENLFFAAAFAAEADGVHLESGLCAACDFQWSGRAVGSVDVVYLLTASLKDGLIGAHESTLLRHYHSTLCERLRRRTAAGASAPEAPEAPSWAHLELEYNLATLDFVRFVIADAPLIDADAWLLARADLLLARLDGGMVRTPAQYAEALNACADATAPSNPLTGVVV